MSEKKLEGKTAVITGAGRGLGKAMALALGSAGASVALVSRSVKQLEEVAKEVEKAGGKAAVFPADVTDEGQVRKLEHNVMETFGKVHILINNAGTNIRKPLVDFTLQEWRQVLDTNLTSVFLMCRSFAPHIKGNGYGRIINIASIMGHIALAERSAYASSKAALLGLTRALALELASDGVTVNGISPGPFATEMNIPLTENPAIYQQFLSKIPLGRWGRLEEVGALALYICSEEAGYVTGTDILIDGGWTAQ
jgi:NAD(P)-dependent dehydrogenase (short-subunit alcohol dehydrogenase family)